MHALELASVTKRFGRRTALADVTLSLAPGRSLGLLGPNGAGKTTALRLLLGFASPSSGTARVEGLDPRRPQARRGVGYLPERLALPSRARVRGFLRLHAALAGLRGADRDQEVDEALVRTGLAERADDRLGDLSKGLRQRAGFAQALLGRPRLLLLDEPTSGLDPLGIRDARGWVAEARARGASVLLSSHVLSEVERSCDEIAILHEGRIAALGPLEALVAPGESLEDVFVRRVRG